ncbi:MAG: o-succinylbenzoate synthase [Acidimicrobiia bacterium]|nr:MAG: o-succinylbenzoate synthase [Acidimicrobiia bacterium]
MNSRQPIGHIYILDLQLRRPFTTASGTVSQRKVAVVCLSVDGERGWGEAAPYPGQDEPFDSVINSARGGEATPTLRAALDEAMADLVARTHNRRLVDDVPGTKTELPLSVAVGMGSDVLDAVDTLVGEGISRIKAKIAPRHTDHVRDLRDAYPDLTMGVDANGSFDSSSWRELLSLVDENIAYLEQPMSDLSGPEIAELSDAGLVIFADESVRSVEQASDVLELPGVGGVVVKPGRLGWRDSLTVITAARNAGKSWRASGLLETGIGRAYSEALAAAEDAFVSDIGAADMYFTQDTVVSRVKGAHVSIAMADGVGVDVDEQRVASLATDDFPINPMAVPVLD